MDRLKKTELPIRAGGASATLYQAGDLQLTVLSPVPWVEPPSLPAHLQPKPPRTFPVGERDLEVLRIGRRKRRLFRVDELDLERDDCWLSAPGWYVDTVNPPADWISNDPFGPYETRTECLEDAKRGYLNEEE